MQISIFSCVRGGLVALVGCGAIYIVVTGYQRAQARTLNPLCVSTFTYRLNVTIESEGKQYASTAVVQKQKARGGIWAFGGCTPTLGTALPFRLADNRLVLIKSSLCQRAWEAFGGKRGYPSDDDLIDAMEKHRSVDIKSVCTVQGFVIDNADSPGRWRRLMFDPDNAAGEIRIVSAAAETIEAPPADQLAEVAPAILKTGFEYRDWSNSPEVAIDFFRRYRPDNKFTYTAVEDPG